MSRPRLAPALAIGAALTLALSGCGGGGGGGEGAASGNGENAAAKAALAYAAQVSAITERARVRLGEISADADYRDASEAAATTREYAAGIGAAGAELGAAKPPAGVAPQHAALVALYATTAEHMEAIAKAFADATGPTELAARAQTLSTEVQSYSTQENELRSSIEGALAGTTPPGASTPAAPTG